MQSRWRIRSTVLSIMLIAFFAGVVGAHNLLSDIQTSWARNHVEELVYQGVVEGYPDGTFKPEQAVTRAEFAKMIAKAFSISPNEQEIDVVLSDIEGHWAQEFIEEIARANLIEALPNGTFDPDAPITRAEAVEAIVRALKLDDVYGFSATPSFDDVNTNHPAHHHVEIASQLKILPPYLKGSFGPDETATRSEAAAMIREASRLRIARGSLDYLESERELLGIRHERGITDFTLGSQTVIHRNTTLAPLDNLLIGDEVYIVADRYGTPQFVKANGVITQEDVATKISEVVKGVLSPSDLQAMVAGDWEKVTDSLKNRLYEELVAQGISPVEAAAIMNQDWNSVREYAQSHAAELIADQLGITRELASLLLAGDWESASELAQTQALERILGDWLMESGA